MERVLAVLVQSGSESPSAGVPGPLDAGAGADWVALGLALALVGSFLLASAILFHSPRDLIEDRFGVRRRSLRSIREPIFNRVQLGLGFAFLLAGFGLQLFGRYGGPVEPEASGRFPAFWIGVVVLCAIGLWIVGWWWSNVALRRWLVVYLRSNALDLEADLLLAREIGELFGVAPHPEDTVHAYVMRLRTRIGVPARPVRPAVVEPGIDDEHPSDMLVREAWEKTGHLREGTTAP